MMRTTQFRRYRSPLLGIAVAALALSAGTTLAGATGTNGGTASIEGVWSFNGGRIAVQHLANGTYAGTVVSEIKFAACTHPVGQQIWAGITEQADGSYWGLHQWYFANCQENPTRGPTAWRILEAADGAHYMRVCFSHPGTSQPIISAAGAPKGEAEYAAYHVTYGCTNSALVAPLPGSGGGGGSPGSPGPGNEGGSGSRELLPLPSAKKCLNSKVFKVRLRDPQNDPLKRVIVTLGRRKIPTSRKGSYVLFKINLVPLRTGTFTIKVHATTVLGHKLSAKRTYHVCTGKAKGKKGHRHGKKG
jgi:hypothetical protein